MEKIWLRGDLSESPYPFVLQRIWKSRRSGRLKIIENQKDWNIDFSDGNLCISSHSFDDEALSESLVGMDLLEKTLQKRCLQLAQEKKIPIATALLELEIVSSAELWELIEIAVMKDLFLLFDLPKGEYFFDTETLPEKHELLMFVFTPDFILEGIRQMKNNKIIQKHMLPLEKKIQTFSPPYLNQIHLNQPERYLYHAIEIQPTLKDLLETNLLGEKEGQRVFLSLHCLGLVGLSDTKKQNHPALEISHAELHRLLESFNNKCSYIFKYISKEIGPAAFSVLEKSLEDIRSRLSPLSQDLRFDANGKIESNSILKAASSLPAKNIKKTIIKDLNEILDAEILAVKKTLGNSHESALVKNLEKIT